MASWRFVIGDKVGAPLGAPAASDRTISLGVSQTATAGFRIRPNDLFWDAVTIGESTLLCFDSAGDPRFFGDIVGEEETGSGLGSSVRYSAADLSWRLGKRFFAKDTTGVGTTYTTTDSGAIAFAILALVNADAATGITAGAQGTFTTRTVTYLWKRALDAVRELGAIDGSYEWALRYLPPVTGGGPEAVYLDLLTSLGQDRTASLFLEYGTGKRNCAGYSRVRTSEQLATRVWTLGQGSTLVANAYDTAAEEARGRYEDVIGYGDIVDVGLLDALASAHVALRKQPREIVTLTTHKHLGPRYGADYTVGDTLTARVVAKGSTRVSGTARVWAAKLQIDEEGNEVPTLSLLPE